MDSIYCKKEKNPVYILPSEYDMPENIGELDVLYVIHMHYLEKVEAYLQYIANIPEWAEVLFTTSEEEVKIVLEKRCQNMPFLWTILTKENRGRDISALLVAAKDHVLRHEYVCFLHDKGVVDPNLEKDAAEFGLCLWENLLKTPCYARNVLRTLSNHLDIGILFPPIAFTEHYCLPYENVWHVNYQHTKELAERLRLHCDMDPGKSPIALGTMFIARTEAVRKLFTYKWSYEDFPPEPMPRDGEISHAIERIFSFVAQDAGYDSGTVMTENYGQFYVTGVHEALMDVFTVLRKDKLFWTMDDIRTRKEMLRPVTDFARSLDRVFVYGAGIYGRQCIQWLRSDWVNIESILVSDVALNPKSVEGVPVRQASLVKLRFGDGIVIAIGKYNFPKVVDYIRFLYGKDVPMFRFNDIKEPFDGNMNVQTGASV